MNHRYGRLTAAVFLLQTVRSQLRRYKAKKLLVSEGAAAQSKAKAQALEFWLVREYCDKGSLSVGPFLSNPLPAAHHQFTHHCQGHRLLSVQSCMGTRHTVSGGCAKHLTWVAVTCPEWRCKRAYVSSKPQLPKAGNRNEIR